MSDRTDWFYDEWEPTIIGSAKKGWHIKWGCNPIDVCPWTKGDLRALARAFEECINDLQEKNRSKVAVNGPNWSPIQPTPYTADICAVEKIGSEEEFIVWSNPPEMPVEWNYETTQAFIDSLRSVTGPDEPGDNPPGISVG